MQASSYLPECLDTCTYSNSLIWIPLCQPVGQMSSQMSVQYQCESLHVAATTAHRSMLHHAYRAPTSGQRVCHLSYMHMPCVLTLTCVCLHALASACVHVASKNTDNTQHCGTNGGCNLQASTQTGLWMAMETSRWAAAWPCASPQGSNIHQARTRVCTAHQHGDNCTM